MAFDEIRFRVTYRTNYQPAQKPQTDEQNGRQNPTENFSDSKIRENNFVGNLVRAFFDNLPTAKPIDVGAKVGELFGRHGAPNRLSNDRATDLGRDVANLFYDQGGATAVGNQILDRLQTTTKSDNFARGVVENLSDEQLFSVGRTAEGAQFLQRMYDHLMRGSVHANEIDAAERIYRAIPSSTIEPNGRAEDARSGAEAAARLKNEDNYLTAEWERFRALDFQKTVALRQNDPVFMREMYQNLGPELTARLMGSTVDAVHADNRGDFPTETDARNALGAVARSLSYMPAAFQRQVGLEAAEQGAYGAAIIFSQPQANNAVRRGFLDGAKAIALGDGYDKNYAARMVGEVLSADSALVRDYLADRTDTRGNRINALWTPAEVTKLLQNGLEVPPYGGTFHSDWTLLKGEGLERVVGLTANFRGAQYADFRARIFRDAASILKESDTGEDSRQSLVGNLKKLFLSNPRNLVDKLFNNTGAVNSPYDSSGQALSLFFRETLFADANPNDPFITTVSQLMGGLRADMLNVSHLNRDPNNERYAKLLGDVLGSVAAAYKRAVADNGEDQKRREALVGTIVDLVAKPIDIPGGKVGEIAADQAKTIAKSLLSDLINGRLKADEKGMRTILDKLFENAFAGARDFDSRHGTNIEVNVKVETIWVDFLRDLF